MSLAQIGRLSVHQALAILSNIGNQLGVALERARLYDLMKDKHISEQAALLKMSNRLLGSIGLDDLADLVVDEVVEITHADGCAIFLPENGTGSYQLRAACGWWDRHPIKERPSLHAPKEEILMGRIHQGSLSGEDYPGIRLLSPIQDHLKRENFQSYIALRLAASRGTSGILLLTAAQRLIP